MQLKENDRWNKVGPKIQNKVNIELIHKSYTKTKIMHKKIIVYTNNTKKTKVKKVNLSCT